MRRLAAAWPGKVRSPVAMKAWAVARALRSFMKHTNFPITSANLRAAGSPVKAALPLPPPPASDHDASAGTPSGKRGGGRGMGGRQVRATAIEHQAQEHSHKALNYARCHRCSTRSVMKEGWWSMHLGTPHQQVRGLPGSPGGHRSPGGAHRAAVSAPPLLLHST